MALSSRTDEYYLQRYKEALANHEDYILSVLGLGVWDVLLTRLNPSALTEQEWQELKQIGDRDDRAKEILVLIRKKDTLSSYIGFSRALCDCSRFLKKAEVFPFIPELEQLGKHPPVRKKGGGHPQPVQIIDKANILWVIQSRKDLDTVLSDYTSADVAHDSVVKEIHGFELRSVNVPVTVSPEGEEHVHISLNVATPSVPKPDYRSFFSGFHPSPNLVLLTCIGSPLGSGKVGDVVVVRRGKEPTSLCAEAEHVTALWRLSGKTSKGTVFEDNVRFGGGTRKSSHESPHVLVSSAEVVDFYQAADEKLKGVATLAVLLLSSSEQLETINRGHLAYCYELVHYFSRKFL